MRKLIWILFICLYSTSSWSQLLEAQLAVYNIDTKLPIDNAHVFFNNTSFGSISNTNGFLLLSFPKGFTEDLILSHVSYDSKIIRKASHSVLSKIDSIFLLPNGVKIDEIVVTQKRSKSWKKNFKRFKKAFLGEDKIAAKCKIMNPEVLRFSNADDVFSTSAVDLVRIQNDYLGYTIDFLLKQLSIDKKGTMKYNGHARFIDNSNPKNQQIFDKNRISAYKKSTKHFFEHLIKNELDKGKYEIKLVKYTNGAFEEMKAPTVQDIVYYDSTSNHYLVSFDNYLQVKHLGFKEFSDINVRTRLGGLESRRFNTRVMGSSLKISYPTSWLHKLTPILIIDSNGNVVNRRAIQEYGYWAHLRMAYSLPFDYGTDYSEYHEFKLNVKKKTPKTKVETIDTLIKKPIEKTSLSYIKDLIYSDRSTRKKSIEYLTDHWEDKYAPPLLDLLRVINDPYLQDKISGLLKTQLAVSNYYEGLQWLWENEPVFDDSYGNIKAEIHAHIDPKFKTYFENRQHTALISLDEIVWGGVKQDGIPPLRYPKMISSSEATYLFDDDIVFGISIDGEHNAYPKRIVAWHEFFVDEIANKKIAGVYCTLCGTMIAYDMVYDQKFYALGTSGFLYRSNKLMYDKETQSLWSTMDGTPVLGPLAGQNIKLKSYSTITTTWGDWKKRHPSTKVLSLDTGHDRNYNPGEAYNAYFSTDKLMFPVPQIDKRLKNKDEVLVIRAKNYLDDPIAISIDYLKKNKIYQDEIADQHFVVLAEKDGWSRVYEANDIKFKSYKKGKLIDNNGNKWIVNEQFILGPKDTKLSRLSSHNSFWFAWFNAHPNTRLIH